MNFLKTFLAALLAFIVANILLVIFFVMIFAGIFTAFETKPVSIGSNSVLRIDFTQGITDSPSTSPLSQMSIFGDMQLNNSNSILEVLTAIDNATYDPQIKGIYINVTGGSISMANIEEVRASLQKFKENSEKFVIAYSETYSQLGYYLGSVADKVFIHPEGGLAWQGLSSQVMFYKGMLDKLGVEVEILRHGTFKSAVEPFMLDKMSAESRMQLNTVQGSIWNMIKEDIAVSRDIDPTLLTDYARVLAVDSPRKAVQLGLVDAVMYEDQVLDLLSRLTAPASTSIDTELREILDKEIAQGTNNFLPTIDPTIDQEEAMAEGDIMPAKAEITKKTSVATLIDLHDYISTITLRTTRGRTNQIAIIYADGDIIDGQSTRGSIGGATIAEKLSRVRQDKKIKGVVVRVNSPGGSALASDVMWREMELLRGEKPVIVSMGGYAASGGYYISCPADMILADRSTITGSIGVFGLLPNIGNALKEKIGITVDVATTEPHADLGSPFRAMDNTERDYMMKSVESVYATFIGHVAEGRNMSLAAVDAIGGGRIWSGANASEIGLVDGIGGLNDAIELCADRAGVAGSFAIKEIVDSPDTLSLLLRSLSTSVESGNALSNELGEAFIHYKNLINILNEKGVQARMPYEIEIR